MSGLLDTILNLNVFAFIGLLIWIYVKNFDSDDDDSQL